MEPYIDIAALSKHYSTGGVRIDVLRGLSAQIASGEICVILGPSGSGKSTLLNIVGGLESADGGTVAVGGRNIVAMGKRELAEYRRSEVGFVFQFYNLIQDLTIRENIETGAFLSSNPLDVDELLESLGLAEQGRKFPREVSGGQQQRCAIGRALAKNPRLLLADEPTGALDYGTSREILALMEQVNRDCGCTIIIVTHNSAIANMAHHVFKLRDGVIVEDTINENPLPASQVTW